VAERAQEFAAAIKPKLGPGQRLETIRELRPEVRSTLERSEQFLGLAASFAVFLAVVAIVLALRRYLKRELDTATLFRTLGAGQRQTLMHFVGQFFVLALIACVLGVLLAFAAQAALAWAVRSVRVRSAGGGLVAAGQGFCHRPGAAARLRHSAAGGTGGDATGACIAPRHADRW
jgi:putative ABC transport system permease protein